jgi:hypothetical protein
MNRIMTSVALLLTTLLAIAPAMGQETPAERNTPRERPQRPNIERRGDEQGQVAQRVQRQIDELKAAHQELSRNRPSAAAVRKATGTQQIEAHFAAGKLRRTLAN